MKGFTILKYQKNKITSSIDDDIKKKDENKKSGNQHYIFNNSRIQNEKDIISHAMITRGSTFKNVNQSKTNLL